MALFLSTRLMLPAVDVRAFLKASMVSKKATFGIITLACKCHGILWPLLQNLQLPAVPLSRSLFPRILMVIQLLYPSTSHAKIIGMVGDLGAETIPTQVLPLLCTHTLVTPLNLLFSVRRYHKSAFPKGIAIVPLTLLW